jgi:antitoxin component HigA of HigAB toxin-antitoxin module
LTTNPTFNPQKYQCLLAKVLPAPIKTEAENERMLAEVWKLMRKGEAVLTPEEFQLLELMSILIEEFEDQQYPEMNVSRL